MSKLLLHIGLPKTGTTAIQEFLAQNVDRLAEQGWNYPTFLNRKNHLALVALATEGVLPVRPGFVGLRTAEALDAYRTDLAAELADKTSSGNWVFSSEHLSSRLVNPDQVQSVAKTFRRFDDIRIVMYARPQDEMAVASHSTWVRDGRLKGFDVDAHIAHDNRYNYQRIALRWIRAFGSERVDLRLYPRSGLLADFMGTLGVPESALTSWSHPQPANVSLSSAELAFLLEINRSVPRWLDDGPNPNSVDLSELIAGSGVGARIAASGAERRKILGHFRSQNEWVLEHASNSAGMDGYFDAPTDEDVGNVHHKLTTEELLHFSTLLWNAAGDLKARAHKPQEDR